jgi:hypothetical protein
MTAKPERYEPAEIHVHAVETIVRSPALRPSRPTKLATAPPKATKHESVAR